MQLARQILCIHLPHWSITRWCRRHPDYRKAPIAVIQTTAQRRQVVDISDPARLQGVRHGMSAAEGRAMCRNLICIEQDLTGDRRALSALGRWMMRFTPDVANGWDDATETDPAVLLLDLTGCERLFGGIDPIVQQARKALNEFYIPAKLAVASTPGAAWAFAFSRSNEIADLPVITLRLNEMILTNLHRLGLYRIGNLLVIPREQLLLRFGASILLRLDQLAGDRIEPLTRLISPVPITTKMEFDSPIEALEDIEKIFEKLLDQVLPELTRRNRGVRQLRMILKPDRGWGKPIIVRTIDLSRAHRHRSTLISLIRCETDRIDCENGFVRFQLDVPLHELITDAQTQLFEQQSVQEQMELERLLQRLRARLGAASVIRPELIESYIPERAWRPAKEEPSDLVTEIPRPLTLFQIPLEIRVLSEPSNDSTGHPRQFTFKGNVHRLVQSIGPERIAGEWWRGHYLTRDYYDVEDDIGQRFWIFRVLRVFSEEKISVRWFVHGSF